VAIFLLSNRWRWGGWVWGGRYTPANEFVPLPLLEAAWALLASPGESMFIYCPPLLVGLWFWGAFLRRFPHMRVFFTLMIVVTILHLGNRTWPDETWGPRRMHYLVPILLLPLGVWIENWGRLRGWAARLGLLVVLLGFPIQLLAVAFDYTALYKVLGKSSLFVQENTIWEPQFSHPLFNLHLLRSAIHRQRTGRSIPFVYENHWIPWWGHERMPKPRVFDLKGEDRLDLWYLQQRRDWPGRPYWFVSASSWLVPALLVMLVAGGNELWRRLTLATGRQIC
jgi:hypothetical protein